MKTRTYRAAAAAVLILCAVLTLVWAAEPFLRDRFGKSGLSENASGMEITFLDVGEGDAALLIADGEAMLVDGGPPECSDFIYSYLKNRGIRSLKYIVCTHPHSDHVGGLAGALEFAQAERAFCCVDQYDTRSFEAFRSRLSDMGVVLEVPKPGDVLALGEAEITVIGPEREHEDLNDMSLVLRVDYGRTSVLLTGDAGYEAELDMMESQFSLRADILKVGHHGSGSSSYYYFLRAVSPAYAVISTGEGNEHGHPSEKVIGKLEELGAEIFRTDTDGTVTFVSDGKTVEPVAG